VAHGASQAEDRDESGAAKGHDQIGTWRR
jgi:hypothetical protein